MRLVLAATYDEKTDTWDWNDKAKTFINVYNSMCIGEQELSVVRLTMNMPSNEDGVVCEYRYELENLAVASTYASSNGKVQQGVYVRYRPAAKEGEKDEMLPEVRHGLDGERPVYVVTFYKTGSDPVTKTYTEDNGSSDEGVMLYPVDDPSTVDGLPLTLADAFFQPAVPTWTPEPVKGEDTWKVRGVETLPEDSVELMIVKSDNQWEVFFLDVADGEQNTYQVPTNKMKDLLSLVKNTEQAPYLLISRQGASEMSDCYGYDFGTCAWTVMMYADAGDYYYMARLEPNGATLNYLTNNGDDVWFAEYDKDGKLLDVFAAK